MINKPFAVGDDNQPLEKAAASNEIRDDYWRKNYQIENGHPSVPEIHWVLSRGADGKSKGSYQIVILLVIIGLQRRTQENRFNQKVR